MCEGEKTEPKYFQELVKAWGLNHQVKVGKNDGSSPDRVVARAQELQEQASREGDAFDEVYCVFDRDAHERFADAVAQLKALQAKGRPFKGTVSVPCFEFWLLLHFGYSDRPYARKGKKSVGDAVVSDLKTQPGFAKYGKGMDGVFTQLSPRLDDALRHAKTLAEHSADDSEHPNPSTQVHELVLRLKAIAAARRG
ncbi:RloB family protein [Hydrogenophaga soli]